MVKKLFLVAVFAAVIVGVAWATLSEKTFSTVKQVRWVWTAGVGGDTTETTTEIYDGELLSAIFDPTGTISPSYDVTITDNIGIDVLYGRGANLDSSAVVYKSPRALVDSLIMHGTVSFSPLIFAVANAGAGATGETIITIR